MRRKLAVAIFSLWSISGAQASPTAVGLTAENPNTDSSLFTDTNNSQLLYVTPPRTGSLQVGQRNLAVDEATCRTVAAIHARRLARVRTSQALEEQKTSIEQFRGAIITQAMQDNWSPEKLAAEYGKFDPILTSVIDRIKKHNDEVALDALPSDLYESSGYYSFVARADWEGAVKNVANTNGQYTVNHVPTSDVQVFVSVIDAKGFKPNELIARVNTGNFENLASVVDGIQVDVEPTKIGACYLKFPQLVGGEAKPHPFGISINYQYQMAISSKVFATYNLKDVYSYVSRSGSSGGLFSSTSWKEITESRNVDEVFHLNLSFEHSVSDAEVEAERVRVREYLLGYAIKDMVQRSIPDGPIGKTGAQVASEVLTETCGANAYCMGAAAGLTILNGIFGNGSTSSSLTQTLDVTRTYDSTVTKTIAVPGAISFTSEP